MLLLPPLLCLAGGAAVPFLRSRRLRNGAVLLCTLLSAGLIARTVFAGETPVLSLGELLPGLEVSFRVDAVNRIFLLLIALLWPLSSLYAFEYMSSGKRERSFFTCYTLAFGVTQLLALSANLLTLYLFYECLTLITLPLVTHREDPESLQAGMLYLKFTVGGAALGLTGLIVLTAFGSSGAFVPGGSLSPAAVAGREGLLRAAFLVSFLGFASKAALFPLSVWLPRASVAPTPVTALLHAVAVVNAGVFACLRLTYDCFGVSLLAGSPAQTAALLLAVVTILYATVMAVRERHNKRRLAWSTVDHLACMLFSAALMTPAGLEGALTHLSFHGLMKISLFFCAGAFQVCARAEYLPDLRGLARSMPRTVAAYTVAALSLVGIPPLIGFLSKWAMLTAAAAESSWTAWAGVGAIVLSSVLSAVYLLEPAVQMIFLPAEDGHKASDPSWRMLLPLGLLALCMLLFGFWPAPLLGLFRAASALY